jgi:DNA processing protein
MTENKYLALLTSYFPLGTSRVNLLFDFFGSYQKIWESSVSDLISLGVSERLVFGFEKYRKGLSPNVFFEKLLHLQIKFGTILDSDYPKNLKDLPDAPMVLYYLGKFNPIDSRGIAVVGSREMTTYGQKITDLLIPDLVREKFTIISGLARGIDTAAHKATLKVGGRTIAVVACGLDMVYPPENKLLAKEILRKGVLFSEYPPGVYVRPNFFVQRNRIISGLSKGVLVIEGAARSGTLLTASQAAIQGRPVFAIPGRVDEPLSAASHFLIKNGAVLVRNVEDILSELKT